MLDYEGFVKAGWVHDLQLNQCKASGTVKFVDGKGKEAMVIHCCGGVRSQALSLYQVPKSYPASALLVSAATRESAFPFSCITGSRRLRFPEDP